MKKSILILCLILLVCTPAYAEENVDVVIPEFNVLLNGGEYNSIEAQYPLINYNGITYFPMTWNLGQSLGLNTSYSSESGLTINLGQSNGGLNYLKGGSNQTNQTYKAQMPAYNITVNGEAIDNSSEEYPILSFRSVTYFPLTWRFAVEKFNWDYTFTPESGLDIGAKATNPTVEEEIQNEFTVDKDGIVTISKTFYSDDLKKNTYGMSKYIGMADLGSELIGIILYGKNQDFDKYHYDTSYEFYDSGDSHILTMFTYGSNYISEEGSSGEGKFGLYGAPREYKYVEMTMTLYPDDIYSEMNQSIAETLKVELLHANEMTLERMEKLGTKYMTSTFIHPDREKNPDQTLYKVFNHNKRIKLPDGNYYRTGTDEFEYIQHDAFDKDVTNLNNIKIDGEQLFAYDKTEGMDIYLGYSLVLMLTDENRNPIAIWVNLDPFEDENFKLN